MSGGPVVIIIGSGGHRPSSATEEGAVTVTVNGLPVDASPEEVAAVLYRAGLQHVGDNRR